METKPLGCHVTLLTIRHLTFSMLVNTLQTLSILTFSMLVTSLQTPNILTFSMFVSTLQTRSIFTFSKHTLEKEQEFILDLVHPRMLGTRRVT